MNRFSLLGLFVVLGACISHAQVNQWLYSAEGQLSYQNLAVDSIKSINEYKVGDFNGDGIDDIFTVGANGQWLVSDSGVANFRALASDNSRTIDDLRLGDFNGDGITDVFAQDPNSGQWFISASGTQSYAAVAADPTNTLANGQYRFADFNGNGTTDVFMMDNAGEWWYSDSATNNYVKIAGDDSWPRSNFRVGDFVGDSRADVFTVYPNGRWMISENGNLGYVQVGVDASRTVDDFVFADINGDAKLDLVTVDTNSGQWLVSYGGSTGGFSNYYSMATDNIPVSSMLVGDFNGNNRDDIFTVKLRPVDTPLRSGKALSFNGSNQSLYVSGITETFNQISIEAWIKFNPTAGQNEYSILSKGNAGSGTILSVHSNKLGFYVGGTSAWVFSDSDVPVNEWVHVAVTYDGSNASFFIDGKADGVRSAAGTIQTSQTLAIGDQEGINISGFTNVFRGEIADVRLWNTVLPQDRMLKFIDQPLPPNQPGLVAYWPINEGSGVEVREAYKPRIGTVVNLDGTTWVDSGITLYEGHAFNFDGLDDYISVQNYPTGLSQITIEAWVKLNRTNPALFHTIFSKGPTNNPTALAIWSDDRLAFFPGSSSWVYSTRTIPNNVWTHVAATFDGTNTRLYINGQLDSSASPGGSVNTSPFVSIGNQSADGSGGSDNLFSGELDELRVWSDVRTHGEIAANMLNTVLYSEPGLVSYWKMDHLFSTGVIDQTLASYNGSVQNFLTRVPSTFFNGANVPDLTTGRVPNGVVSINNLLSGAANATYDNILITGVPDVDMLYVPGEVVVNVDGAGGGSITGGNSAVTVFGLPFSVSSISLENAKLKLDASVQPPSDLISWTTNESSGQADLLLDGSGVSIAGGRVSIDNAFTFRMFIDEAFLEIRPNQARFAGGGDFQIVGLGPKGAKPRGIAGSFGMVDGQLTELAIAGTRLGIPMGNPLVVLNDVGFAGTNLNDFNTVRLSGNMKIGVGRPIGPIFPLTVDALATVTPSNGYTDLTGGVTLFSLYPAAGANIFYRPPTNLSVRDAFIDIANFFRAEVNMDVHEGAFTGSLKGRLTVPQFVPFVPGVVLGSAEASILGENHFRGSVTMRGVSIGTRPVQVCVPNWNEICADVPFIGRRCVRNFLPDICTTINVPDIRDTITVTFEYNDGNITGGAARQAPPELPWETSVHTPHALEGGGTVRFMTNWELADKAASNSSTIRPFDLSQTGEPVTTFTVPDGPADAIFRITFQSDTVTELDAFLTLPDGTELDINEGEFPEGYEDGSGFTDFDPENRFAAFFLFDPPTGDYTITIEDETQLGEYSVELLLEIPKPFMDLVSITEGEEANVYNILFFGTEPSDTTDVKLYLDRDREGRNGVEITNLEFIDIDDETVVVADMDGVPPGWYFPYLAVNDGANAVVHDYANAPIFVSNDEYPESVVEVSVEARDGGFAVEWVPIEDETITNYTVVYTTKERSANFEQHEVVGVNETSAVVTGLENGTPVLVSVLAGRDDGFQSPPDEIRRVVPTMGLGQTPAIISSEPLTTAAAGVPYFYFARLFDGDTQESSAGLDLSATESEIVYNWQLLESPSGMTIDAESGFIQWLPTDDQIGDVTVVVGLFEQRTDVAQVTELVDVQQFTISVVPVASLTDDIGSTLIQFTTQPTLSAIRGEEWSYIPRVIQPQGYELFWDLVQVPEGMDVDDDGVIRWEIDEQEIGQFLSIEAVLVNEETEVEVIIDQTFYLDVVGANEPPTQVTDWALFD